MSEPFLGTALVSIEVDPKGFRTKLRETVNAAIGVKPFKIPITPDLVRFRKELNSQLRLSPIKVPVVPDLTIAKFRAELLAKVNKASEGIRVRIPVDAVGGAGGRAAGGGTTKPPPPSGTPATKDAEAQKAASAAEKERRTVRDQLNAVQTRGTVIERELAVAVDTSLPADERKARLTALVGRAEQNRIGIVQALVVAQREQNASLIEGLTTLQAEALAQKGVVESELAAAEAQVAFASAQEGADAAIEKGNAVLATNVEALGTKEAVQAAVNKQTAAAAELSKAAANADRVGAAATAAYVRELEAEVIALGELLAAQKQSIVSGQKFNKELGQFAKGAQASAAGLLGLRGAVLAAGAQFLAAVVAIQLVSKAIGSAAGLQKQLSVFRVTAEATATQMEAVRKEAIQLGNDITLPGVNARDAADAITELAKAGLSVQDSLDGARGVLELATAAEIDNANATNIVASALNSFGLKGNEAVHIADLLANASIKAQGGIADMGDSLANVASVARQVGLTVEDTVALITLLAKNGIQGAEGGTVLRVALLRLVNPSKQAAEELKKLNVQIRDQNGNVRPDIFAQLQVATEHYTKAQRDAALATIFGTRGIRAQAILGREGAASLNQMRAAVERTGAAQELAHAQTAGLSGAVEGLKNSLETLGLVSAEIVVPGLTGIVDALDSVVIAASKVVTGLKEIEKIHIPAFKIPVHLGPINFDFGNDSDFNDKLNKEFNKRAKQIAHVSTLTVPEITVDLTKKSAFGQLIDQSKPVAANIDDIKKRVQDLFKTFRQEGQGPTALNELIAGDKGLGALAEQLDKLGPEGQKFATRLRSIIFELQTFVSSGKKIPPINLAVQLDPNSVANLPTSATGPARDTGRAFARSFGDELKNQPIFAVPDSIFSQFPAAGKRAGELTGEAFSSGLATQIALAQASGASDQTLIGLFQKQAADARKRIEHLQEVENRKGITAKEHAKIEARIREAAGIESSAKGQIKSIRSQAESEAKQQAQDVITARNKADQAFIDKFTQGSAQHQNAIAQAALSKKTLKDDIAAQEAFRKFILGEIDAAGKGIKDAKTKAQFLVQAKADLISIRATLKDLNAQQKQLLKDQAQAARDLKEENLTLDVQIAQATDNKSAEAKALNREIAFYRRQSRNKDLTAIERKRYLLKLRQAQADLKELKKQQDKLNNDAKSALFSILQESQGFSTNLLGNLIGLPLTGGLVGNVSGGGGGGIIGGGGGRTSAGIPSTRDSGDAVAARLKLGAPNIPSVPGEGPASALAGAGNVSRSQGDTLIHLQRQTLRVLLEIAKGLGHPEARHHQSKAKAKNITVHGD